MTDGSSSLGLEVAEGEEAILASVACHHTILGKVLREEPGVALVPIAFPEPGRGLSVGRVRNRLPCRPAALVISDEPAVEADLNPLQRAGNIDRTPDRYRIDRIITGMDGHVVVAGRRIRSVNPRCGATGGMASIAP